MPNYNLSDKDVGAIVDRFKDHFGKITVYSWLREPDYCENYKEMNPEKIFTIFFSLAYSADKPDEFPEGREFKDIYEVKKFIPQSLSEK